MIRLSVVLGVVALCSLGGCKKQPSPAQLAAATFVEGSIKNFHTSGEGTLDGNEAKIGMTGGEPVEGSVFTCGEAQGTLEWVRSKSIAQTKQPNGDMLTETAVDICMRADGSGGSCTRPNSYSFKALMRSEGSAWKVAGSTCTLTNSVR